MQALCSILLDLLTSKALVLVLQYSSQRLGNGLFHAPEPCTSGTIPLRAPPVELSYPASKFSFQDKDFATAHGSIEPQDFNLALVFHAVSLQSPRPLPESLSFIVTAQPLGVVGAKPRTIHGVVHLLSSY